MSKKAPPSDSKRAAAHNPWLEQQQGLRKDLEGRRSNQKRYRDGSKEKRHQFATAGASCAGMLAEDKPPATPSCRIDSEATIDQTLKSIAKRELEESRRLAHAGAFSAGMLTEDEPPAILSCRIDSEATIDQTLQAIARRQLEDSRRLATAGASCADLLAEDEPPAFPSCRIDSEATIDQTLKSVAKRQLEEAREASSFKSNNERIPRTSQRSLGTASATTSSSIPGAFSGAPGQGLQRQVTPEYQRVYNRHSDRSCGSAMSDLSDGWDESETEHLQQYARDKNESGLSAANASVPMPPESTKLSPRQKARPATRLPSRKELQKKLKKTSTSGSPVTASTSASSLCSREDLEARKRAMGDIVRGSETFSSSQLMVESAVFDSPQVQSPDTPLFSESTDDIEANQLAGTQEDSTDSFGSEHDADSHYFPILDGSTRLPIAAQVVESNEFRIESLRILDISRREEILHELMDDCSISVAATTITLGSQISATQKIVSWTKENKTPIFMQLICVVVMALVINSLVILYNNQRSGDSGNEDDVITHQSIPAVLPSQEPFDDTTFLAAVPATICYEAAPLMGQSRYCPPQPLGSPVTNLVAQSRLWSMPDADISILNAGEVHADIPQGNLTVGMSREVLPFQDNTLVLMQLEGSQIAVVLERALDNLYDDLELQTFFNRSFTGGSYPYGAGIRFNVDMSQPFPQRVTDIQVKSKVLDDDESLELWQPLDLQKVYTVVTSSYLASGGDGYREFHESRAQAQYTGLNAWSEFVTYCQEKEILESPSMDDFSTQSYGHAGNFPY